MSKVGLLTAQCSLLIAQKFSVTMSALGRIRRRESPLELRVCPLATGEVTTSGSENIPQLPNHKVKIKKQGQRACNEKDAKGKFCGGHLKLWSYKTDVVERE